MPANQTNLVTANLSLGPADALASVGNRDNIFSPVGSAAVAHVGNATFNYRASSGGGPKCWWSQKVVTGPTACDSLLSSPTATRPLPSTSRPTSINAQTTATANHSTSSAVPIPLLSPPLSLSSPSLPISHLDLGSGPLSGTGHGAGSVSLPLTPESTPPTTSALHTAARDQPSFFPSSLAPGFLASLLPNGSEAARARGQSTEVEVVARDGSVWFGAVLSADAAKAMELTSVEANEGAHVEPVLCVAVPSGEGVEIREGVEMIMDLASECLSLARLVLVLDKASPDLRELLHGLLFIGGTLVPSTGNGSTSPVRRRKDGKSPSPPAEQGERWTVSADKVLVGIDL